MTSRQLFALNRRNSILRRLRDGEKLRDIANAEGVVMQYVSAIAVAHGIRRRAFVPRKKRAIATTAWTQIGNMLDLWNQRNRRGTRG